MKKHLFTLPLYFFLICCISSVSFAATNTDLDKHRQKFLRAEHYFVQRQYDAYRKELRGLEDYPLYPYLEYSELRRQLVRAPDSDVQAFLEKYPDTWFGEDIRHEWLRILAKRQNWKRYIAYYVPTKNIELTCHYLYALSLEAPAELDTNDIADLWYRGKKLPTACEPVIAVWQQSGGLTKTALVERTKLAFKANNIALVNELMPYLPANHVVQIEASLAVKHKDLINYTYDPHAPLGGDVLTYRLQQLIDANLEEGMQMWENISTCYTLSEAQQGEVLSTIAVKLAARNDPRANEWLQQIPDETATKSAREWRIREAIRRQDWEAILKWTALLPPEESGEDAWIYWRARAWENLDAPHKARRLYSQAAQIRSYYGFLAAQKLELHLPLNHQTIALSAYELHEAARNPGIQRARELYAMGQLGNARREWEFTVAHLSSQQQMAAAKLAHSWNWHDSALMTANKTALIDDLEIRFPMPHLKTVLSEAQKRSLSPALVFGIIRQESAFMPDARSNAGALGLMQVRPESAKDFATRVWKEPAPSHAQMMSPDYNIRVGSAYFNSLVKEFGGQIAPAIAAYNAGPGRAKKWMPAKTEIPVDEWIETLPYYETREYLKHVLAYLVIYTHHLHKEEELNNLFAAVKPISAARTTPANEVATIHSLLPLTGDNVRKGG